MPHFNVVRLLIASFLIGLPICYWSITPKYELRGTPPAEFVNAIPDTYPSRETLAAIYWQRAINLRASYAYLEALPNNPPILFADNDNAKFNPAQEAALQSILWKRLRVLWMDPANWSKSYALDFGWITNLVLAFGKLSERLMPDLHGAR